MGTGIDFTNLVADGVVSFAAAFAAIKVALKFMWVNIRDNKEAIEKERADRAEALAAVHKRIDHHVDNHNHARG